MRTSSEGCAAANRPWILSALWTLAWVIPLTRFILEWAAGEGRILVTGDVNSMVGFSWGRVHSGLPMPGVLALKENVGIGRVIDDILLVAQCYTADKMKDQVLYIPL